MRTIPSAIITALLLAGARSFLRPSPTLKDESGVVKAPLDGYEVFIPSWEVEVRPSGETAVLNGTVQQVHAELLKLNPNYDNDYRFVQSVHTTPAPKPYTIKNTYCFGRWFVAEQPAIHDGIRYLRQVKGRPYNDAGPGRCGRVSCSYYGAIWWCNDNPFPKTLNSFGDIADGAQYINDNCCDSPDGFWTSGQVFYADNWNVIVRMDLDNC